MNAALQAILVVPPTPFLRNLLEDLQKTLLWGDQNYDQVLVLSTEAQGGAELVAKSHNPVEWKDGDSKKGLDCDTVRFVVARMGGSVQQSNHWRIMEPQECQLHIL